MLLVVRVLLVWALVLALPVQGFAVAATVHCEPAQAVVSLHDTAVEAHGHHAPADTQASGDHHCSVCAACCIALALPVAVPRLAPLVIEPTFSHTALPALPSFVPAGLDRPPRPSLA